MNVELYNKFLVELEDLELSEKGVTDKHYDRLIEMASTLYTDALCDIEKMGWTGGRQSYVDTVLEIRQILTARQFLNTQ